jgi:hypothetical protein
LRYELRSLRERDGCQVMLLLAGHVNTEDIVLVGYGGVYIRCHGCDCYDTGSSLV